MYLRGWLDCTKTLFEKIKIAGYAGEKLCNWPYKKTKHFEIGKF